MSINPLYLGIDLETQTAKKLSHDRKDFLNGTASCFGKQNLLHTSTEGKSVFFRLFPRKHTREKIVGKREMPEALTIQLSSQYAAENLICLSPIQATEAHNNEIPLLQLNYWPYRYMLSILGQQRMGIIPATHTLHVSGWNWDEEWRVWEAALFPMLSLPMVCLHWRRHQSFRTRHRPSAFLPVCLPNCKLAEFYCIRATLEATLGLHTKNRTDRRSVLSSP